MPTLFYIPLAVLTITLPVFLAAEIRGRQALVLPLKMLCSLCFVSTGVLGMTSSAERG